MILIKEIDHNVSEFVVDYIIQNWGSSIIVSRGKAYNINELSGFVAVKDDNVIGIITYRIEDNQCEIITLDSLCENSGIGSTLINQVISVARCRKCKRVWLITTNDNIHAIRYYQKRGFNMKALYRNAVDQSRKMKPQIPTVGFDNIPIQHEIEFEKILV